MATSPFLMEDQTDEDFFDKLVDDEFRIDGSSAAELHEGNDSDGINDVTPADTSIAKLSLSEPENRADVQGDEAVVEKPGVSNSIEFKPEKVNQVAEESSSDVLVESEEPVIPAELVAHGAAANAHLNNSESDFPSVEGSKQARTSVKEVQWSSFHTDMGDNDFGGFGSHSDFFAELDENTSRQTGGEHGTTFLSTSLQSQSQNQASFVQGRTQQTDAISAGLRSSSSSVFDSSSVLDPQKEVVAKDSNGWAANCELEAHAHSTEHATSYDQLQYSPEYWESLYPGWRYDHNTGEWHQIDGYNAAASSSNATVASAMENSQENGLPGASVSNVLTDHGSEISHLQKNSQPVVETVGDEWKTLSASSWNETSHDNFGYPSHMYFHPDYPGWYYDCNTQTWHQLDAQVNQSGQMVGSNFEQTYSQQSQNDADSSAPLEHSTSTIPSNKPGQVEEHFKQEQPSDWHPSVSSYVHNDQALGSHQQVYSQWGSVGDGSEYISAYNQTNGQTFSQGNMNQSAGNMRYHMDRRISHETPEAVSTYWQATNSYESEIDRSRSQSFSFPDRTYGFDQSSVMQGKQSHYSHSSYRDQQPSNYLQPGDLSHSSVSRGSAVGRTSAGRPLHALVTFGFGGRIVVMKANDPFSRNSALENQDPAGGMISVHNMVEIVKDKSGDGSYKSSACDYFHTLCQQSFPGPLVGGNVANKDVLKWVDERIATCESSNVDYRRGESLRLLFSLLKISCQHYGKLRSPFGVEAALQENDGPESAVTKLFASARRNGTQLTEYGACTQCLQVVPSEVQMRSTAIEMQKLLVAGRRLEALRCAQEGQLWGPALVLAGTLGEKFYVDTVKQMAHHQFMFGSPLRTLCLLIAGQLADVFSSESTISPRQSGALGVCQAPAQTSASSVLDDWEENLAIVIANRTKDDELMIIHLGDCLWRETGEVSAAHACYLIAETNFEAFSDTTRLCLVGADHWNSPRTYASPNAIQRTELYEYAKVLGNSQFVLQPFQPYKVVYAHMLAEVGKVSESLRYCQAILKVLKNAGRTSEVESWKLMTSSLEERLRTHQQGGYASNLAPAKLMGKVLTSIDRSIHRIIGAPLPPLPPAGQTNAQNVDTDDQPGVSKLSTGPPRTSVATLMPSASMEPISEWAGDNSRVSKHTRSISEPDFGRSPRQGQNAEASPSDAQGKASNSGGATRFGRFGSQLLQKAVGFVSRSRQAKLGEKNKFYYDEKLKRWVEEGVDPQAEAAELAPPPTSVAFQTAALQADSSSYSMNSTVASQNALPNGVLEAKSTLPSDYNSGIPPIPPTTNQFSARGRLGVRSRYVDTFNKGGGAAPPSTFQTPALPSAKPGGTAAKFFIPTPTSAEVNLDQAAEAAAIEASPGPASNDIPVSSLSSSSPPPPPSGMSSASSSMHRFPSMDNITPVSRGKGGLANGSALLSSRSRAASWSGGFLESTKFDDTRPLSETLASPSLLAGSPPGHFVPVPSRMSMSPNASSFGDDLQEVEL
ncbi:transport protein SEC16B-like protein [Nymphaea thermarum]|nr:transport protein SEC16B-like protein [Nymphaea thermarum]